VAEVPETLEGWYALHDFRRIEWPRWKTLRAAEQEAVLQEAAAFLRGAEECRDAPEGSSALFSILGHKSDLLLLHLRPTIDHLSALERAFARLRLADFTAPTYSYLSVTELSLHDPSALGGKSLEEYAQTPYVQKRLKFQIPEMPYACFYPMNKRRGEQLNWYATDPEERHRMMQEHGTTGRKFAGRITQMITGSMGLDDWEWGVTLFANNALDIKKLVYAMRFDEVSARYAEFGAFQVGVRVKSESLADLLRTSLD
jgi:chlorite dismutase